MDSTDHGNRHKRYNRKRPQPASIQGTRPLVRPHFVFHTPTERGQVPATAPHARTTTRHTDVKVEMTTQFSVETADCRLHAENHQCGSQPFGLESTTPEQGHSAAPLPTQGRETTHDHQPKAVKQPTQGRGNMRHHNIRHKAVRTPYESKTQC